MLTSIFSVGTEEGDIASLLGVGSLGISGIEGGGAETSRERREGAGGSERIFLGLSGAMDPSESGRPDIRAFSGESDGSISRVIGGRDGRGFRAPGEVR